MAKSKYRWRNLGWRSGFHAKGSFTRRQFLAREDKQINQLHGPVTSRRATATELAHLGQPP
mgnify:CR=1 FL=1